VRKYASKHQENKYTYSNNSLGFTADGTSARNCRQSTLYWNTQVTKNSDGSISVTFKAAGLGTGQYDVFLTADEVTMVLTCVNPSGKNEPPGHNPPPDLNVVGPTKTVDARNGQLTVGPPGVILPAPETPTPEEAGCKSSPGWTVKVLSITFEGVVLHVQPIGSDMDVLSFPFGNVQTFPQ
jgi:hypothetical protein